MNQTIGAAIAGGTAILALLFLLLLLRFIRGRNREIPDARDLWAGREYRCPDCSSAMIPGWVLGGRGLIWSDRDRGMPGAFSTIAAVLPNTLSLSIRPACNQGWRCPSCRLVLVDHSRLVGPARRGVGDQP